MKKLIFPHPWKWRELDPRNLALGNGVKSGDLGRPRINQGKIPGTIMAYEPFRSMLQSCESVIPGVPCWAPLLLVLRCRLCIQELYLSVACGDPKMINLGPAFLVIKQENSTCPVLKQQIQQTHQCLNEAFSFLSSHQMNQVRRSGWKKELKEMHYCNHLKYFVKGMSTPRMFSHIYREF